MTITFTAQELTKPGGVKVTVSEVTCIRCVDNKKARRIISELADGFGRHILFQGNDYPANGIHGKTQVEIETAIKAAIGVV